MVRNADATLEIVEAYPQDKYLPSFPDEWDEGLRVRRTR
jgi:hypothetical protein